MGAPTPQVNPDELVRMVGELLTSNGSGNVGRGAVGLIHAMTRPEQLDETLRRRIEALDNPDVATVFRLLNRAGVSQRRIAALTGQSQSEISEILKDGRQVKNIDLLARIADGLGVSRRVFGLANIDDTPAAAPQGPPRPTSAVVVPVALPRLPAKGGPVRARRGAAPPAQLTVIRWTGHEVQLLRQARRMSVRDFGAHLGVSDRMVSKWLAGGLDIMPRPVNQEALDTSLKMADPVVRQRFYAALAAARAPTANAVVASDGTADEPQRATVLVPVLLLGEGEDLAALAERVTAAVRGVPGVEVEEAHRPSHPDDAGDGS